MAPQLRWRSGSIPEGAVPGQSGVEELSYRTIREERSVLRFLRSVEGSEDETNGGGDLQQVRVHPGIIAAVVVVGLLALLAAIFIIKKYCFPESNITYRYSVLRNHQEELDSSATNRLQEDSDEDLLQ